MVTRSQIKFHESFQPEVNYISSIIALAAEEYSGTKFEISEYTGIPTGNQKGKVDPTIKYASFMGMLDYSIEKGVYSLHLSPVGMEVFAQDRYLHEELTRWLCHYFISNPRSGAPQWSYLVHQAHCGYINSISQEYLLGTANSFYSTNINFNELFGVVKRSYTGGFFEALNYVSWGDSISFVEHQEKPELIYVYAYALLHSWEQLFPSKSEITLDEVEKEIGLGKIFGFSPEELDYVLSSLMDEQLISINRQLYPATVMRKTSSESVISRLYCRLL